MKTLDTKVITVPIDWTRRPNIYEKTDDIHKWVDNDLFLTTSDDDVVVLKFGEGQREIRCMISFLSSTRMLFSKIGGKVVSIERSDEPTSVYKDVKWLVQTALNDFSMNDLISIIVKRLCELQAGRVKVESIETETAEKVVSKKGKK